MGLPLVALLLLLRRVAGELSPLPGAILVLVGLLAAMFAVVWRVAWRALEVTGPNETDWRQRVAKFGPPIVLAMLLAALSMSGTHWPALGLFWLMLIGEEVFAGWWLFRRLTVRPPLAIEPEETAEEEPPLLPPGVSQQITRRTESGREVLNCLVRANFAIGEQHVALHLAFCPPLCSTPTAEHEQLDGPPCDIKLTESATYGARLELKRRSPLALADEVLLRVVFVSSN